YYSDIDQGIFNQVYWNSTHGRFFQSSLSSQLSANIVHEGELPNPSYRRLGQHFTPALMLWLPIYYLFPSPATLCVLQATFTTVAGLLLYAIARQYLAPGLSLGITTSFYCAIAVLNPILANFHDLGQIPLFVFGLLLAMEKRKWWVFGLLCLAIVLVREDSAITLFGVGAYAIASRRFPRVGVAVCALCVSYFLLVTNVFMPFFSEDISKRFMIEEFGQYVDSEEASTLDVIVALLRQPRTLLSAIFWPLDEKLEYLAGHWLPLAFVPALSPASWLLSGLSLVKLTLAQSGLAINIRYALNVVPGMFYGGILWWAGQGFVRFMQPLETLRPRKLDRRFQRFWVVCIVISLLYVPIANAHRAFYFMMPDSIQPWVYVSPLTQWQRAGVMNRLVEQIAPEESISATNNIVPHLSGRRVALRLPFYSYVDDRGETQNVDTIVADLWLLDRYQVAFRRDRNYLVSYKQLVNELLDEERYGAISFHNGVVMLKRDRPSDPEALQQWQQYSEGELGAF
ncbi:MAG: DUF2079 domain-containing protein, partial [Cyanobacteria bacterium J06639_1]